MTPSAETPAARIDVRLSVVLTFEGIPTPSAAVSINLSESGILVRAGREVSRGTQVQLDFKEFKAKGEVIWTGRRDGGALLGIRFNSLRGKDLKAVRNLVALGDAP